MSKCGNSHGNVLEMKVEKNSKITVTLKSYLLDHDFLLLFHTCRRQETNI